MPRERLKKDFAGLPLTVDDLEPKHARFAMAIFEGKNARDAYRVIFPNTTAGGAEVGGAQWKANSAIREYVQRLVTEQRERVLAASVNKTVLLIQELEAIIFSNPLDAFTEDGRGGVMLRPLDEIPEVVARSITSIGVGTRESSRGDTATQLKVSFAGRSNAFKLRADIAGLTTSLDSLISGLSQYGIFLRQDEAGGFYVDGSSTPYALPLSSVGKLAGAIDVKPVAENATD